jgi:hypothetical protein
MANVSIKSGISTFTFADSEVDAVEIKKNANLDENTMPASDSDSAFILDFNGVKKDITLTGQIIDTTGASRVDTSTVVTIEDQINWLTAIPAGSQTGLIFNSSYQTNKKVYMRSIVFTEKAGDPLRVVFRIELVEGL